MEFLIFFALAILVVSGAFLQSLIGIGFGLLVAPFLVLYDPGFVPVPMLLVGTFLPVLILRRDRNAIDFTGVKSAIAGRIIGSILAVWLITGITQNTFILVFGGLVIVAVFLSIFRFNIQPTASSVGIAGFFSGLMGTFAALGGPPMAIVYQNEKGNVIRGTLSAFFILGTLLSLFFLSLAGRVTLNDFKLFAYLVPGILVGFYLSKSAVGFVDRGYLRKILLSVSFLAGILVIVKALVR
jgi:uncharacterized membrane protein YfcA